MFFKQLEGGFDRNFAYIIADEKTKESAIVDPFSEAEKLLEVIQKEKLKVLFILNTHSHLDHIEGNAVIVEKTKAKILSFKNNQIINIGKLKIKAIFTPGHSPDHFCFLVENKLLTGDLLFVGKIGGTGPYFPGSSSEEQFRSLAKIMEMPEDTEVWPGHNYGLKKNSTIGYEKKTNPFLLSKNFQKFQNLKEDWEEYKKKHNLK